METAISVQNHTIIRIEVVNIQGNKLPNKIIIIFSGAVTIGLMTKPITTTTMLQSYF